MALGVALVSAHTGDAQATLSNTAPEALMLFALLALALGVVIGAYSHKWLAKVTGAPANLSVAAVEAKSAAVASTAEAAVGIKPSAPTTKA